MTPSFGMHFLGHMSVLGNMIQRGMPLGALVVVDPIQKAGAIAAAVVVAEVSVGAGARASLQRPNLRAAHLLNCGQGLLRDLALLQSLVLCQDLDQDPDLHCLRVRKGRVKAQRGAVLAGAQAGAGAGARVCPGEI